MGIEKDLATAARRVRHARELASIAVAARDKLILDAWQAGMKITEIARLGGMSVPNVGKITQIQRNTRPAA